MDEGEAICQAGLRYDLAGVSLMDVWMEWMGERSRGANTKRASPQTSSEQGTNTCMAMHAQAYARSCGVEDHRTSCIQVVDHEPITPQVSMVAIRRTERMYGHACVATGSWLAASP